MSVEKLEEVCMNLFDLVLHINTKAELLRNLDINQKLLSKVKNNSLFTIAPFKTLLEMQVREYCIIDICSFIDEYEKFFTSSYLEGGLAERVLQTRKFLKPFLMELQRDYDMKDYRNHILAHNYRVKAKSLFSGNFDRIYRFPQSTEEFLAVGIIVELIWKTITEEFVNEISIKMFEDRNVNSEKIVMDETIKSFDVTKLRKLFDEQF